MPQLFLIRHAESQANAKQILAGRIDSPLSPKGHSEAKHIAEEFKKNFKINKIISSTLTRAKETASYFAELFSLEIETDPRIMEQNMGDLAGLSYQEIESHPGYESDKSKRWDWQPPNGESYQELAKRIKPFLEDLQKRPEQDNILIVNHGVAMRLLQAHLLNTLPQYPIELARNGEIYRVSFQGLGTKHELEPYYFAPKESKTHRA